MPASGLLRLPPSPYLADEREAARRRWQRLLLERERSPMAAQGMLGPQEHGAYAELRVLDSPLWGPVEQLIAIPGYTAAKSLGLMTNERTTPPSLDEMAEAYRGLGRGLRTNLRGLLAPGYGR